MTGHEAPSSDILEAISRCAAAMDDQAQLKAELHFLRLSSDPLAQFATSLIDLERARRGDSDAKVVVPELAEALLAFWADGDGPALSAAHPLLGRLWRSASALLASFEVHQLDAALAECWSARGDAARLALAIEALQPAGERRVEFARCLYHLELARLMVDSSRGEFSRRVRFLADAYRNPAVAAELIGGDVGLGTLWSALMPSLGEFFGPDAGAEATRAEGPALRPPARAGPAASIEEGILEVEALGVEEVTEGEVISADVEVVTSDEYEVIEELEIVAVPPPLPATPSPLPVPPPKAPGPSAPKPAHVTAASQPLSTQATAAFWVHTFKTLELLPGAGGRSARIFPCENRADRARLTEFIETLGPHMAVPEARALASLIGLMLAGQSREKGRFTQGTQRRAGALAAALAHLDTDAAAAGRAAVWFELDGAQTRAALGQGLELLVEYLAFCLKNQKDPLAPSTVEAFTR